MTLQIALVLAVPAGGAPTALPSSDGAAARREAETT